MAVAFFVQRRATVQTQLPESPSLHKPLQMKPRAFPPTMTVRDKPHPKPLKLPTPLKKSKKQKLNVSGCVPNPNTPDYLAKQMNKAVDPNACGRVHINFDF